MIDTELNGKSLYRKLRRRAIRRGGKVILSRKKGSGEDQIESLVGAKQLTPSRLIGVNEQGAVVFTKDRHRVGDSLDLTLVLGDRPPLRTIVEVAGIKMVKKHDGYLTKLDFPRPKPEHEMTINQFLLDIDSLVAQEMRMVL